jgi:type I restriction enzyme R subunit
MVRVIDFNAPENNEFLIVSQLWIMGSSGNRRPDILLYINGLPLIFIELKRSDKPLENAYQDNLLRYRDVIPQLFVPNVACILSNGSEAKIGAYNASFQFFKDWYRAAEPKDLPQSWNKQQVQAQKAGLAHLVRSFCNRNTLIDYIENFILYEKDHHRKIIAQNHQFLGVNNALAAYHSNQGTPKIGTFWHTQGSGKSYSMVFFTEKLRRK